MKNLLSYFFVIGLLASIPFLVLAEARITDISIIPPKREVGDLDNPRGFTWKLKPLVGEMYLKHEGPAVVKVSDNVPFVGIATSGDWNSFFAEAYILRTDKGKDGEFGIDRTPTTTSSTNKERSFNRQDYSIAVGYTKSWKSLGFSGELSGFGGYRKGETHIRNLNITLETARVTREEVDFEAAGFYAGIGLSFKLPFTINARIGINGAYGPLSGKYKFSKYSSDGSNLPEGFAKLDDTDGQTYSAYWSHEISPAVSYALSVDYYGYSMGVQNSSIRPVKETLITGKASLIIKVW